ncbi:MULTISPECIES: YgaP family membrane protein [Rhizobium/Agrobacterium group]
MWDCRPARASGHRRKVGRDSIGTSSGVTAVMRTCPMYSILGIQTCKV